MRISWQLQEMWDSAKCILLPLGCVGLFGCFLFLSVAGVDIIREQSKCPVIMEACQASYYLGKQQGFMGPYVDCLRSNARTEREAKNG